MLGRHERLSDPWRSGNAHNEKAAVGFPRQRLFRAIRRWSDSLALFWRLMRDAADALEGDALECIAQIQMPISQLE